MRLRRVFQCAFGTVNTQYKANKIRSAVRFQTQNIDWNFQQADYQIMGFARGITELGYKKNDNILVRLPSAQASEAYTIKAGAAAADVNIIVSHATTKKQAEAEIINNNPTLHLDGMSYYDWFKEVIPELKSIKYGEQFKCKKFPLLTTLVQTNFYSYNGIHKFKSIMNYSPYENLKYTPDYTPLQIKQSNNAIFVTNPAEDLAFRAGVLNSLINGRFLVSVQPLDIQKLCLIYKNKVDVICTQQLIELPRQVNVYVQKGSKLQKQHPNRIQL